MVDVCGTHAISRQQMCRLIEIDGMVLILVFSRGYKG
jgi:hypothetical protein